MMEEYKNLYRLADELYDLMIEAEKKSPLAYLEALKQANYFMVKVLEELKFLIPVEGV